MDAQILHELIWIRWLVTAMVVAAVIFTVAYLLFFGASYRQNLESIKTGDCFARGNALLTKGRLDELLELCDKHLLDFPADAGVYWLKANAHYRRKEWNQALVCYRKADELQPGWAVGPPISEIEERIAKAGTSPELKIVAPVTPIQSAVSSNAGSAKDVDA